MLQEWEEYVLGVDQNEFRARLVDLTMGATCESYESLIPIEKSSKRAAHTPDRRFDRSWPQLFASAFTTCEQHHSNSPRAGMFMGINSQADSSDHMHIPLDNAFCA